MAPSSTARTKKSAIPDTALQEVDVPFDGQVYSVRPDYRLLARIERMTELPAREIGLGCYAATLSFQERKARGLTEIGISGVAPVLAALLIDRLEKPLTPDQIGDILFQKGGYLAVMEPLALLLTRHINGSEEYERESREKAKKQQEGGVADTAAENPPVQAVS